MKLNEFINDDDAVSPVIGVILMVAITVILAAVIATFVLGLGESVSETAPSASFSFDFDGDVNQDDSWGQDISGLTADGALTITHSGGATIQAARLSIRGTDVSDYDGWSDEINSQTAYGDSSRISAGDSLTIGVEEGDTIRVVWTSQDGGDSATLSQFTVPE